MKNSPFQVPAFRALWIASLASNIGTWIQDVGAAWLMTSLAPSPLMVALIQSAATAPMFLLALPAGVLADIVDRRKLLIVAQLWMLAAAASLAVLTFANLITPFSLLAITFALGLGFALNSPAWQAIIPSLVPRDQLDAAVTLSGVGINVARAIGPAIGGILVAQAGPQTAFMLNAVSYVGVLVVLIRWRPEETPELAPKETFWGGMMLGIRYVWHNPQFQAVLIRTVAFLFFGSALWAHLPLVARDQLDVDAGGYGMLLGMIGLGAVFTAFGLPRLRQWFSTHTIVLAATSTMAVALLSIGWITSLSLMCVVLFPIGAFWVAILSSLNVAAQTTIAPWIKARALAVYLLMFFGSLSLGSICWGFVADQLGIQVSLTIASAGMIAAMSITFRFRLAAGNKSALMPSLHWPTPEIVVEATGDDGPILVIIEYEIPEHAEVEFRESMQSLRQARMRTGAYRWYLSRDMANPTQWKELFLRRVVVGARSTTPTRLK